MISQQKRIKKEDDLFKVLSIIGAKFSESNIVWAVGASVMLNQLGLIKNMNDLDILVDIKDIKKVDEILRGMGKNIETVENSVYSTTYFYEYVVEGIEIDIMAGFSINHDNGVYDFILDHESISKIEIINGVKIPFTSVEDWYVIYQLIPKRQDKVNLIENYLTLNGINNPYLLKRALMRKLPLTIKSNIKRILGSQF